MSFIHHFFADNLALAEDLARNEKLFRQSYLAYLDSVRLKQRAAADYERDPASAIMALRRALSTEIALIKGEENNKEKMAEDLDGLENGMHRQGFDNLKGLMDHALSRERFLYNLMDQLRQLLLGQARVVEQLARRPELLASLRQQLALEDAMVRKLPNENLLPRYKELAMGARVKDEIRKDQQDFAYQLNDSMNLSQTLGGDGYGDAITELTEQCFNSVQEEYDKARMQGYFRNAKGEVADGVGDIYQYVNSTLFDNFAEKEATRLHIDERTRIMFIKVFRRIYNDSFQKMLARAESDERHRVE